MLNYEEFERKIEAGSETDYGLYFMIFMVVFWPVSLVLALIDFYFVPDYDLRLVTVVLGGLAGWVGVVIYRKRAENLDEIASS